MSIDKSEAGPQQPELLGMRLDTLTDSIWRDIIRIYYRTAYDNFPMENLKIYERSDTILDSLRNSNSVGFRFGSKFSVHSKLEVWHERDDKVRFSFYTNEDGLDDSEVQEVSGRFKGEIDDYLRTHNLA